MSRNCYCDGRTLLNYGCKCSHYKPRTLAINFTIAEVGHRRCWEIIKRFLWRINYNPSAPTDDQEVLAVMWNIERFSPSIYDEIAREFEEEFRGPPPSQSPYSWFKGSDDSGF